jgi:uncharacterized protein (DUF983 family)
MRGWEIQIDRRDVWQSIRRGSLCRCPSCGDGRLFRAYTKTVDRCNVCGEEIHHHRADDLPAYLVILLVGHLLAPFIVGLQALYPVSPWMHMALWIPFAIVAALLLLQPVKGAVIGLQWALRMHGFGHGDVPLDDPSSHNADRI